MSVTVDYEANTGLDLPYSEIVSKVVSAVLAEEKCPCEAAVNVLLTDSEQIQKLNNEFRNIDSSTDVLSFPAVDFECPGDYGLLDGDTGFMYFDPDSGELMLGDIAISVERVISQAEEYGHSQERELAFLTAHSMLHLLGYDHTDDSERIIMEDRQREILDNLGIFR